jgi:hypothetical protein
VRFEFNWSEEYLLNILTSRNLIHLSISVRDLSENQENRIFELICSKSSSIESFELDSDTANWKWTTKGIILPSNFKRIRAPQRNFEKLLSESLEELESCINSSRKELEPVLRNAPNLRVWIVNGEMRSSQFVSQIVEPLRNYPSRLQKLRISYMGN